MIAYIYIYLFIYLVSAAVYSKAYNLTLSIRCLNPINRLTKYIRRGLALSNKPSASGKTSTVSK